MKHTIARILMAGGVAGGTLVAGNAAAIDWNVTGFVRQGIAVSLGGENYNNTWGNKWNGRVNENMTYNGSQAASFIDAPGQINDPSQPAVPFGTGAGYTGQFNSQAPTTLYQRRDENGNVTNTGGLFVNAPTVDISTGGAMPVVGYTGYGSASPFVDGDVLGLSAGTFTNQAYDCHGAYFQAVAGTNAGAYGGLLGRNLQGADQRIAQPNALQGFAGACDPATNPYLGGGALNAADDTNFNLFSTRIEVDVQAKINDQFSAYMKIRGYADATSNFMDADMGDNYGQADYYGNRRATRLEYNWNDVIVDIPHFYLDWNKGPLWIRAGNQVIAWGEAYFFRTMDVANGLDLRRHLTLGPGAEEYQDQRIASPGIRVSYTFNNGWEIDAFAQLFQPTVLPGQNTPYNVIPMSGARFDDSMGQDDAENAINYGFKLNMPLTEAFTGMVAYVNRRNPDGVFQSADAPREHAGLPNTFCGSVQSDTFNALANFGFLGPDIQGRVFGAGAPVGLAEANAILANPATSPLGYDARMPTPTPNKSSPTSYNGCGSAFAPDPRGSPSQQYWTAIQKGRLDNFDYLASVIDDFAVTKWATRDIYGFGEERNFVDTMRTVEGFRANFGPFIQWVGREFKRENIFMVGGNYLVTSDNEWLDQLIIRGEVSWTPNKRLTNDLRFDYTEVDDVVSSLIFEKYQRLSASFPATYMVAQWMHRTSTDLFGRDLDNNDVPDVSTFIDPVTGNFTAAAFDPEAMRPRGTDNANYVVFAFQQPFPNLIWRFDFAVLVDVAGGYLLQPGVRYRPSAKWQWDFYSTIIESPGGQNDTITETLDWADEFFVRLTYFF